MTQAKHRCGACEEGFADEAEYNANICAKTGLRADTIEHHDVLTGGQHSLAAAKAIERGATRKAV